MTTFTIRFFLEDLTIIEYNIEAFYMEVALQKALDKFWELRSYSEICETLLKKVEAFPKKA